jgi:hypothetical protein
MLQECYSFYIQALQPRRILGGKEPGRGRKKDPMFQTNRLVAKWLLIVAFFLNLTVQNAVCAPEGAVNVALEWGSSARTSYTYVFSGLVTCQNHPCSNAHVDLDMDTANQGVISQSAQAGEDGRYQLEITIPGSPEDSASWKIQARAASVSDQESGEAEGRIILMEGQTKVNVDRSLLLIQA